MCEKIHTKPVLSGFEVWNVFYEIIHIVHREAEKSSVVICEGLKH